MEVSTTGWFDPNLCNPTGVNPGSGTTGRAFKPSVTSHQGVVSSASKPASDAGIAMLNKGGNAVDAAVATVFAIGVTLPSQCGIGGGGFLVYRGADGETAALDFRETAPADMTATTLSDIPGGAQDGSGHVTVGVPGVVAGMATALESYGTKSLAQTIEPAARLAEQGIEVSEGFSSAYLYEQRNDLRLRRNDAAADIYLRDDGTQYPPDNPLSRSRLVQEDYATSLRLIAEHGPDEFYTGSIADKIAAEMDKTRSNPGAPPAYVGIMTADDLANYKAIWRTPLVGTYKGAEIIGMPPPTAGGIFTLEVLNILEGLNLGTHSSTDHFHYAAEAQKIAWADRNAHIADPDPDFYEVPTEDLVSKSYADERRDGRDDPEEGIDQTDPIVAKDYAAGSFDGQPADAPTTETATGSHTTHVSVIDRMGNAVAVTCSVGFGFGSAVVAPGTGFVLNDEMLDFDRTPNQAEGGKRPRSSMSPTIVVRAHKPVLVTGAAGGVDIPMGVVHSILNVVEFGMDIAHAIDAPRSQEFSLEGGLAIEDGRVSSQVLEELRAREHTVGLQGEYRPLRPQVESAGTDLTSGGRLAVSDPREAWGAAGQGQGH